MYQQFDTPTIPTSKNCKYWRAVIIFQETTHKKPAWRGRGTVNEQAKLQQRQEPLFRSPAETCIDVTLQCMKKVKLIVKISQQPKTWNAQLRTRNSKA